MKQPDFLGSFLWLENSVGGRDGAGGVGKAYRGQLVSCAEVNDEPHTLGDKVNVMF